MRSELAQRPLWQDRQVLVCMGTGGVGKTSIAAALGLAAAAAGKRTLIMTIDPARRLAQALGLGTMGAEVVRVDPAPFAAQGVTLTGSLDVLMPDVRATYDAGIRRWAPTPAAAQAVLDNVIYQHFASALAGSHEYAAVEQLYEAHASGRYDLIVLDTPPAQNALAFLRAPDRILDFLATDAVGWLMGSRRLAGRMGGALWDLGGNLLLKGVGKLAGGATIAALMGFIGSLSSMYDGFVTRAAAVKALLRAPQVAFILVGAPPANQRAAMRQFYTELCGEGLQPRAAILNRVAPALPATSTALQAALDALPTADAAALRSALVQETQRGEQHAAALKELQAALPDLPFLCCPELPPQPSVVDLMRHLAPPST